MTGRIGAPAICAIKAAFERLQRLICWSDAALGKERDAEASAQSPDRFSDSPVIVLPAVNREGT